jgi:hypothetical protein
MKLQLRKLQHLLHDGGLPRSLESYPSGGVDQRPRKTEMTGSSPDQMLQ